jgi:hypothetical protein
VWSPLVRYTSVEEGSKPVHKVCRDCNVSGRECQEASCIKPLELRSQGGVGICERSDRVFAPYSANACDAMDDGRGMGIGKKRSSNMVGTGAEFGNTKHINSR